MGTAKTIEQDWRDQKLALARVRYEVSVIETVLRSKAVHGMDCEGSLARGTCTCWVGAVAEHLGRINRLAKGEQVGPQCNGRRLSEL